jgi:hypothetical protein
MKQYAVPDSQKAEYIRTLEQAHRYAQELEPKLPLYFYVLKDPEMIRKLIAIVRIIMLPSTCQPCVPDHLFADLHNAGTADACRGWRTEVHLVFEYPLDSNPADTTSQRAVRCRCEFLGSTFQRCWTTEF